MYGKVTSYLGRNCRPGGEKDELVFKPTNDSPAALDG